MAFTLMMVAFSLRTWRRNGVACDELLFLPGTPHGHYHGIDSPSVVGQGGTLGNAAAAQLPRMEETNHKPVGTGLVASTTTATASYEGDVAAGGVGRMVPGRIGNHTHPSAATATALSLPAAASAAADESTSTSAVVQIIFPPHPRSELLSSPRNRLLSKDSSISSIQEFINSWEDEEGGGGGGGGGGNATNHGTDLDNDDDDEPDDETAPLNRDVEPTMTSNHHNSTGAVELTTLNRDTSCQAESLLRTRPPTAEEQDEDENDDGPVQRFRQNHPQITRIGSFFFFRSSATSTQNAAYAPSGPSVVGAALDLSMPILFNFHLFIEAFNHMGDTTPAKILPLIFLTILMVRCSFPPGRRGRFYNTMKFTFMAPFHASRFRDSYIGDVLTSLIRPFQDVMFALSYYVTVVAGTISGKYGLSTSGEILVHSWWLHNVILPSVALVPLWFKFLQTLREAYDHQQRWPYLGNAFKYLSAALVILYGMTHPEDRRSPLWLICFAWTMLYQIYWDVCMDWELLVIAPTARVGPQSDDEEVSPIMTCGCSRAISSFHPNSHILLSLHRYVLQPTHDGIAWVVRRIPSWRQIQLRPRRLYKTNAFYWWILAYNAVFRFTWMLCFIPAYHLSASGTEQVTTFSSDTNSYVGVLLPVAEILRRTFWGFLYLEMKTIKLMDGDPSYSALGDLSEDLEDGCCDDGGVGNQEHNGVGIGSETPSVSSMDSSSKQTARYLPSWLGTGMQPHTAILQHTPVATATRVREWMAQFDNEAGWRRLFVAELSLWAVAFVGLGIWATS